MQKARKTQRASVAKKCHDSLYWRSVGHWLRAGHGKGVGHQVVPLQLIADWLKGTSTGSYHLSWEKAWFPLDFPLNLASKTGSEMAMEMVENAIGNRIITIEIG